MAANLKKSPEDKKAKVEKAEGGSPKVNVDLKWILAGLGLVALTMGSVIIGIQLAPGKIVVRETTTTKFVQRVIKPGPVINVLQSQVLNLAGGRCLRLSVALQFVADEKLWPEGGGGSGGHGAAKPKDPLEAHYAMIKDTIVMTASKHSSADLLAPSGKEKLKEEIKRALNREFGHDVASVGGVHVEGSHGAHGDHGGGGGGEEAHASVPEVYKVYFTDFVIN